MSSKVTFKHSLKAVLASNHFQRGSNHSLLSFGSLLTVPSATASRSGSSVGLGNSGSGSDSDGSGSGGAPRLVQEEAIVFSDIREACRLLESDVRNTPNLLLGDEVANNTAQLALSMSGAGTNSTEGRVAHATRIEAKHLVPPMRKMLERSMEAMFRTAAATPPGCIRAGATSWLHRESMTLIHQWATAAGAKRFLAVCKEVAAALLDFRIDCIYAPYSVVCCIQGQYVSATALPVLLVDGAPEVLFYPLSETSAKVVEIGATTTSGTTLESPIGLPPSGGGMNMITDGTQDGSPSSILELAALQLHAALGMANDKPVRLVRGADGRYYFNSHLELLSSRMLLLGGALGVDNAGSTSGAGGHHRRHAHQAEAPAALVPQSSQPSPASGQHDSAAGHPPGTSSSPPSVEGYYSRPEALRLLRAEKKPRATVPPSALADYVVQVLVPRAAKELIAVFSKLSADEKTVPQFLSSRRIAATLHQFGVNICYLYAVEVAVRNSDASDVSGLLACIQNDMVARAFGRMAQIDIEACNREGQDTMTDRVDVVNRLATFAATKDQQFWNEHLMPFVRGKFASPADHHIASSSCHTGAILRQMALATGCEFDPQRGRFERFVKVPSTHTTRPLGWLPLPDADSPATAAAAAAAPTPQAAAAATVLLERRRKQLLDEIWADSRAAAEMQNPFWHCAAVTRACVAAVDAGKSADAVSQLVACIADASCFAKPPTLASSRDLLIFWLRTACLEAVPLEKRAAEIDILDEVLADFHEGLYLRAADVKRYFSGKPHQHDADALLVIAHALQLALAASREPLSAVQVSINCQSLATLMGPASHVHTDFRVNLAAMSLINAIEPLVESTDNEGALRSIYVMAEQIANSLAALRCRTEAIRYLEKTLWRAIGTPAEAFKATAMMAILIVEKMHEWDCVDEFDRCVALYIAALSAMCVICRHKQETLRMTEDDASLLGRRVKLRDTIRKVMERIRNVHVDQWVQAATNNVPLTLIYRVQELLRANGGIAGSDELFGGTGAMTADIAAELAGSSPNRRQHRRSTTASITNMSSSTLERSHPDDHVVRQPSFGNSFRHRMSVVFNSDGTVAWDGNGDGSVLLSNPDAVRRIEDRTGRRLADLIKAHIRRTSPVFYAVTLVQRVGRAYLDGRSRSSALADALAQRRKYRVFELREAEPRQAIVDEWERTLAKLVKKEADERKLIAKGRRVGTVWGVVAKASMAVKPHAKKDGGGTSSSGATTPAVARSPMLTPRLVGSSEAQPPPCVTAGASSNARKLPHADDTPPVVVVSAEPVGAEATRRSRQPSTTAASSFSDAAATIRSLGPLPSYMGSKLETKSASSRAARDQLQQLHQQQPPLRKRTFTPEPLVIAPERLETRVYSEEEIRERMRRAEETAHELFVRRMGMGQPGFDWTKARLVSGSGHSGATRRKRVHHLQPLGGASARSPSPLRSRSALR